MQILSGVGFNCGFILVRHFWSSWTPLASTSNLKKRNKCIQLLYLISLCHFIRPDSFRNINNIINDIQHTEPLFLFLYGNFVHLKTWFSIDLKQSSIHRSSYFMQHIS
jgi:hypothetical protein